MRNARRLWLAGVMLLMSANALAINKCVTATGSVSYQEAACPSTSKATDVDVGPTAPTHAPAQDVIDRNKKACEAAIHTSVLWKDPDSVKIDEITRVGPSQSFRPHFSTVIMYVTQVNAKNSYGGYGGKKFAACEFDLAEKSVQYVYAAKD